MPLLRTEQESDGEFVFRFSDSDEEVCRIQFPEEGVLIPSMQRQVVIKLMGDLMKSIRLQWDRDGS